MDKELKEKIANSSHSEKFLDIIESQAHEHQSDPSIKIVGLAALNDAGATFEDIAFLIKNFEVH